MSNKTITMPLTLAEESIDLVAKAGEFCEKIAAEQETVAKAACALADELVKSAVGVDPADKGRLEDQLKDHVATMQILAKVAKLVQAPASMGQAEKSASASYDQQTSGQKESDRVFEAMLNRANDSW